MGRALRALLDAGFADCTAGPMVSRSGNGAFASFSEVLEPADIVLDFSFHTATEGALDFALEHGLPIVIGTTGHTQQECARIERASEQIPVFFSGNMSLGIAALCGLVREAARLFPEAEIEIVETHHSRKADAPSGTAPRQRRRRPASTRLFLPRREDPACPARRESPGSHFQALWYPQSPKARIPAGWRRSCTGSPACSRHSVPRPRLHSPQERCFSRDCRRQSARQPVCPSQGAYAFVFSS